MRIPPTASPVERVPASAVETFVVPVTVMLAFVSFWRASAIILCDLGSSAYYVGGIAEKAVGKAAPWFVLAVMLFSYAVRAIYIESCSMFVRGGVYRVVHKALGGTAAKFSVSALLFDYVLTGPISGVSAGLCLAALLNELGEHYHQHWMYVPGPAFAAIFAAVVTLYFWYTNRIGVPFSSISALRIMQATTVMVVILITWCLYTIFTKGFHPVPTPLPSHLHFGEGSLGWLKGTALPSISGIAIAIGLGHSVLALSGEESLAQVYREIEAPKQKNLLRTGLIIFLYSLLFTSLVSFFAVMIIPDAQRGAYLDDLIGGLAMFLSGPFALRLAFHCFVVVVGTMILAGAVNTAIIGSNGVLNRIAEDGVLPPWFRQPHPKHGTSYRIIGLIVALQLITIALSRGNVDGLGEAYAFGVVWSFAMKGLAVAVLRFKYPEAKRWKFPGNLRLGRHEIPLGLLTTTAALFAMALINLFTKKIATLSGVSFTLLFFAAFWFSERKYAREQQANQIVVNPYPDDPFRERTRERFRFQVRTPLSPETAGVTPCSSMLSLDGIADLHTLDRALARQALGSNTLVAVVTDTLDFEKIEDKPDEPASVPDRVNDLFSEAVFSAEALGTPLKLLAFNGTDSRAIMPVAAARLKCNLAQRQPVMARPTDASRQE